MGIVERLDRLLGYASPREVEPQRLMCGCIDDAHYKGRTRSARDLANLAASWPPKEGS